MEIFRGHYGKRGGGCDENVWLEYRKGKNQDKRKRFLSPCQAGVGVQVYGPFITFSRPAFDCEPCPCSSFEAAFSSSVDSNQRPSSPFGISLVGFWEEQTPGPGGPTPGTRGTWPMSPQGTSPSEDNICKVTNSEVLLD